VISNNEKTIFHDSQSEIGKKIHMLPIYKGLPQNFALPSNDEMAWGKSDINNNHNFILPVLYSFIELTIEAFKGTTH
jgi:hypothetical protein